MDSENPELKLLIEMGYPDNRARKALFLTGAVKEAVNWLVDHENDADIDEPIQSSDYAMGVASSSTSGCQVMGVPSFRGSIPIVVHPNGEESSAVVIGVGGDCKVVMVVPRDRPMSPGKLGSQCAHASIGIYRLMLAKEVPWMAAWEWQGEKMVVLGVESSDTLPELMDQALNKTLLVYPVYDAGLTEVKSGTLTVLAIGGLAEVVDQVTGRLSLY